MKSELFQFKRFSVSHSACSMKIGVDAVLLGCLADVTEATAILDAGCGCGVISLICAQRVPAAQILGIDIHIPSVKEAAVNFAASPWAERMEAEVMDYLSI